MPLSRTEGHKVSSQESLVLGFSVLQRPHSIKVKEKPVNSAADRFRRKIEHHPDSTSTIPALTDSYTEQSINSLTKSDMSNFFSLPCELRNQIYELVLLHQEVINPWDCYDLRQLRQELTLELFNVSKIIHREASWLFYAQNRFDFSMGSPEDVASFLGQIGRNNSDCIRHICVDFPKFSYLDSGDITLEDDSFAILANIQSCCTSLRALTTSPDSTNAMELRLDALDSPKVVAEALKLADTHFRAISSLQEIIVNVYEDGPSDYIRRKMESHGWTISIAECVEEEDFNRSLSDFGCGGYGYDRRGDDGDGDDSYDIDNDSDFWRRAAD